MRFSVAAILLTVSESLSTWSAVHVHGGKRSQSSIIRHRTLQTNDIIRAAQENRLTAAQRRLAFHLNHLKGLSNGPRILKANVYCDPSSTDPDIGILSCGDSHMCQASLGADSEFGGICVPKFTAKKQRSGRKGFIGLLPKAASRHGLMFDDSEAAANPVPCDPTSSDIGILACGQNNVCEVDESSELGGFCSSTSVTSRRLATVDVCNETSPYYTYYNCNCNGLDNTTGTGTVDCTVDENYAPYLYSSSAECRGITLELSLSFTYENSVATSYNICYEIITTSNQKFCISPDYGSVPDKPCIPSLNDQECSSSRSYGSCFLTLDDQPCISCNTNFDSSIYDCSNVEGGGAGQDSFQVLPILSECMYDKCTLCAAGDSMAYAYYDINVTIPYIGERSCGYLALVEYLALFPYGVCPVASEAAQKSCCAYQCDLCSPGTYIPVESEYIRLDLVVPGYEGFTCGTFASAAYVNFSIPKGTCASIAGLIQETCCQARRDECSLCDGPLTNPNATVTIEGDSVQCAKLQSFLTAQECRGVLPHVSPVCCSASVAPVPVGTPTAAPTTPPLEPGSEEADTPDAATGIFTKGGFLASVGGVMLAAFFVVASC